MSLMNIVLREGDLLIIHKISVFINVFFQMNDLGV
jgi:hypothetical protein